MGFKKIESLQLPAYALMEGLFVGAISTMYSIAFADKALILFDQFSGINFLGLIYHRH